jgi:hypothetical protein
MIQIGAMPSETKALDWMFERQSLKEGKKIASLDDQLLELKKTVLIR